MVSNATACVFSFIAGGFGGHNSAMLGIRLGERVDSMLSGLLATFLICVVAMVAHHFLEWKLSLPLEMALTIWIHRDKIDRLPRKKLAALRSSLTEMQAVVFRREVRAM